MKCWLEKNNIDIYSSHNEGKSVVDERFIRALKTKIYKYVTSMPKNAYLDKLDDKNLLKYIIQIDLKKFL